MKEKNEYNQGAGKTTRIIKRLKNQCEDSNKCEDYRRCEGCPIKRETIEKFGVNLL